MVDNRNLEVRQMDVKYAFLNGKLEAEIYMEEREGFVIRGQENKVNMLGKSLYGLRLDPKQWHKFFEKYDYLKCVLNEWKWQVHLL